MLIFVNAESRRRSANPQLHQEAPLLHRRRWERREHDPSCRCQCMCGSCIPSLLRSPTQLISSPHILRRQNRQQRRQIGLAVCRLLRDAIQPPDETARNSYWRLAKLAQFVIHHRLIILVMQAVFSSIFHFSPIALYQGWLIVGYATIYMMVPMFSLVLDRLSAACEWPFLCRFLSMS